MKKNHAIVVIFLMFAFVFICGCAGTREPRQVDRTKMEYDEFKKIPDSCLASIKAYVAKEYSAEYFYSNTIKSREPHYLEAVFTKMEKSQGDTVVIVKIDTLCAIKRAYKTRMNVSENYR